jgi:1-deoxy-D-xylulose-5-phosphate reductoisomerase
MEAGGTAAAVLNAANEVAVAAFLERRLPFTGIAAVVEQVLSEISAREADSLELILEDDAAARERAQRIVQGGARL